MGLYVLESGLEWGSNKVAFCLSDGFVVSCACVFVLVYECVCVYAKVLITGLYKQVNWREKSNKGPCSSFNIPTTSTLRAALMNVCMSASSCMCVSQSEYVCAYMWSMLLSLCVHVCISMFVCYPVFVWQWGVGKRVLVWQTDSFINNVVLVFASTWAAVSVAHRVVELQRALKREEDRCVSLRDPRHCHLGYYPCNISVGIGIEGETGRGASGMGRGSGQTQPG